MLHVRTTSPLIHYTQLTLVWFLTLSFKSEPQRSRKDVFPPQKAATFNLVLAFFLLCTDSLFCNMKMLAFSQQSKKPRKK